MNDEKRNAEFEDRVGGLLVFCGLIIIAIVVVAIAGLIKMCATQWP